jgi:hypothetical protein
VQLRQSYLRIAKRAAMLAGRYAHAKQFNRHRRQLRLLRTRLGRIIRDIRRNIGGKADLEAVFEWPLTRANQIRSQQQRGKTRTIRFFRRSTRPTARKWRIVRILNVVDGCIPSDRATSTSEEIEEERRLLYVAMTRAKDELDLIVNRFFTHQQAKLGDRHVYATRCRFIPESILDSFASRSWWDHTDSQIEARKKARSSVDVAASLIWMWR